MSAPDQPPPRFVGTVCHDGCIAVFVRNDHNRCPGCGSTNWEVGRQTAVCGFCGTVLPIVTMCPAPRPASSAKEL